MLWFIIGLQLILIVIVLFQFEATLNRLLSMGNILEKRLKHVVEYIDRRERKKMKRDVHTFAETVRKGDWGEELKMEWEADWLSKTVEAEKQWEKDNWEPFSSKLYEEEN